MRDNARELIISELINTQRPTMKMLTDMMNAGGFFIAPASGDKHLCVSGGLAEHSLNVLEICRNLNAALDAKIPDSSIVIVALLHDLGKMGDYRKENYVPNMIKDGKPTKESPEQKYKQSEAKPFETNKDLLYIDHEIRSVEIARQYIELTEEENWAILMHNGLYGSFKYEIPGKETPLYLILHTADMWASRVIEVSNGSKEK